MTNTNSKTSSQIWQMINETNELIKKENKKHISNQGLTPPQFHVLEVLYYGGPTPLKRISEILFVTGANITCVVDNLEKIKLVKRIPSDSDRRIILATLTPEGQEKIKKMLPVYKSNLDNVLNKLSESEKVELSDLLKKIIS